MPAGTSTATVYQRRFLAIVDPVNMVGRRIEPTLQQLPPSATGTDVSNVVQPYIDTVVKEIAELRAADWPPPARGDVHGLVSNTAALIRVMELVSSQTPSSIEAWVAEFQAAGQRVHASSDTIRHDLGLPPS